MREQLNQLQSLYTDYIQQCRQVCISAPYGAGVFSPGKDPRSHPCHDTFYHAVGQLISGWTQNPPEETEQIIRYMLETPYFYANEDACWFLLAAQNHAKPLIPLLDRDAKASVADWFSRLVPKKHRLPVQEEILKLLTQGGCAK